MTHRLPKRVRWTPAELTAEIRRGHSIHPGYGVLVRNGEREVLNPAIRGAQFLAALDFEGWQRSVRAAWRAAAYTHYALIFDETRICEHYWPHTRVRAFEDMVGTELLILAPSLPVTEFAYCPCALQPIVRAALADLEAQTPYSARELIYYLKWSYKAVRRVLPGPNVPFWDLFKSEAHNVCSGQGVLWNQAAGVFPPHVQPEAVYPARYLLESTGWSARPRFRPVARIKLVANKQRRL